jgi:hypothetical protein
MKSIIRLNGELELIAETELEGYGLRLWLKENENIPIGQLVKIFQSLQNGNIAGLEEDKDDD